MTKAKGSAAKAPASTAPKGAVIPGVSEAIDTMDGHQTHAMDVHVDAAFHEEFPHDWKPPALLQAPTAREGHAQRWVRMSILGQNDPKNLAAQSGQGWRPRRLDSVPSADRSNYPTQQSKKFGEIIVDGALVLCEMPLAVYERMEAYYTNKRIGQQAALKDDQILRQAADKGSEAKGFGAPKTIQLSKKVSTRTPPVASD